MICVTSLMAYVGGSSDWKYYMTADEFLAQADQLAGARLRVSGRVAPGSLHISESRDHASFLLAGQAAELEIECETAPPDNLQEGMDVVVEGRCEAGRRIHVDKVLTRCASKYDAASGSAPKGTP